ncbi:MAG: hypothetical protein ETSY1_25385 [Candidatus Entotheonella factor]|uniref:Uncharacterized protein n=1 Tax=Entotheonella factor TaxID=1429438 RepID=W4LG89_ENTF1|nr:MAG: hypothetical protein ETSY1_25385 [Candidatus Entotheonella factor]
MKQRQSFRAIIYHILEVSPPDHKVSRFIRRTTLWLVGLNTLALLLSFVDVSKASLGYIQSTLSFYQLNPAPLLTALSWLQANLIYSFWGVETISTAWFTVGFALRLWSAPEHRRVDGRNRLFFLLLLLIDFIVILPFFVALLTPSRELTLQVLRLGWAIRHLKLIRYLRQRPAMPDARDALLNEAEAQLVQVRQQVVKVREADLARVNQHIETVRQQCVELSMQPGIFQRHESGPLAPPLHARGAEQLRALFDSLETDLTDETKIHEYVSLIDTVYHESASVFDPAPRRVAVDVTLTAKGLVGQKHVPLRRIGRNHFGSMAWQRGGGFGKSQRMYVPDIQRDMTRARTDLRRALELGNTPAGKVSLSRTIHELRDFDVPVRLAWDGLMWQLEEAHHRRLQLVGSDIDRYGSLWFYLASFWRWLGRRLGATRRLLEFFNQLIAAFHRLRYNLVAVVSRVLRPWLLWLGFIKPPTFELLRAFDEARLDSVRQREMPESYLKLFEFAPLSDKDMFLALDEEFEQINYAIRRWQEKRQSSFLIYGHRGFGKTTLMNMARQQLFTNDRVTHESVSQKIITPLALRGYLTTLLELDNIHNFEDLADSLLASPPRVVLLEDCNNLFFRNIDGLEAIRYLFWLIARTNHHILWGIGLNKSGYDFLDQALPLHELFYIQVCLRPRSGEELRRLIMMRHNQSGVSLYYEHNKENEKALRRQSKILRQRRFGRVNQQEALELTFFDALATTCAGNISTAFYYWLRAIEVQSSDRYAICPFEALNLSLIRDFTPTQAFLLVALLQHDYLNPSEMATILDMDEIETRLELEILQNHNILEADFENETFVVNPVVQKDVCDMLESRNLL